MNTLVVENFGPIRNHQRKKVHLYPVTVFCGDQGSGKSTIAKLISEFSWLEKALARNDFPPKEITQYDRFRKKYCAFHSIQNYFKKDTYLLFEGNLYTFEYKGGHLQVTRKPGAEEYLRPQIMYVPAERNLISALENAEKIKRLPASLSAFMDEYLRALRTSKSTVPLPLDGFSVQYDKLNKIAWIVGKDFKIRTQEAASGIQSVAPLSIVSHFLANTVSENLDLGEVTDSSEERYRLEQTIQAILKDKNIDDSIKVALIRQLNSAKANQCFINIVEEPEQNLFPTSQRAILNDLLGIRAKVYGSILVFTTHSPYILDYLTLSVKAGQIKKKHPEADLRSIVPEGCELDPGQLVIYQLTPDGNLSRLDTYEGLPSDDNFLNRSLAQTNSMFSSLLEREDQNR